MTDNTIIETDGLKVHFNRSAGILDQILGRSPDKVHAVDGVTFTVNQSDSIAVIGESGCGKTTLLQTLVGMNEPTSGEIRYQGKSTNEFNREEWKEYRRNVQIIYQNPYNSLNPRMTVEEIVKEPLHIHNLGNKTERVRDALERTQLRPPVEYMDRYPTQLSGGQKQRVSIARAIVSDPDIILADEPVSMLDVSTQASILNLLSDLTDSLDLAIVYISHDISTVASLCDTINVMYLGRFVESAGIHEVISDPHHPYTRAMIGAVPRLNPNAKRERTDLRGAPSDSINIGEGCRFRDRCPDRMDVCEITPKDVELSNGHQAACHLHYDDPAFTGQRDENLNKESNIMDGSA